jgi:GNAT superfamily N-acetyltransferase
MFRYHQHVFPEGQYAAVERETGRVVGFTVSMRTNHDPRHPHLERWWQSIGSGWLTTHNPRGEWMYGVETAVLEAYRSRGVGSRLMDSRFQVLRRMNLRGMVAGSLIMDYGKVADHLSVKDYVQDVIAGRRFDTNLTKQLHKGFQVRGFIPNYVLDETSRQWGVLIVWDNPDYRPDVHLPHQVSERQPPLYR